MSGIVIYSKNWCGYCRMAKQYLSQLGLDYSEIDVTYDADLEAEMRERSGRHTVPQIFINDQPIGGFTELIKLGEHKDIRELLNP